eukprot:TRINITY_DN8302_c0_g3_i1.p1 TRINITY_DN8302_c0_g3~~TRINITY_DN8302_c0_g3_i1.p1  ORF type:complete len:185 (-),score=21.11 TRINITY_DN8302_c0_g3_i1:228-752(-)
MVFDRSFFANMAADHRDYYSYYGIYHHTPHYADTYAAEATDGMSYAYDSYAHRVEFTEGVTTLCIRNLPCKVDQPRMNYELWRLGFGGLYDLLYLPRRSCGKCLGYGFINFRHTEDARRFVEVFKNYSFDDIQSAKSGYAEPSRVQGFEANLYQFTDALFNVKRGLNTGPLISL